MSISFTFNCALTKFSLRYNNIYFSGGGATATAAGPATCAGAACATAACATAACASSAASTAGSNSGPNVKIFRSSNGTSGAEYAGTLLFV